MRTQILGQLEIDEPGLRGAAAAVTFPIERPPRIPDASLCHRAPLSAKERADLLALAPILDLDNLRDAIGIVVKKHYRKDGGDFVWNTLGELAGRRGGDAVGQRIRELHRYYTMERTDD